MDEVGPGSLKCVSAHSPERSLRDELERTLLEHIRSEDVGHLYGDTFLVFTDSEVDVVRGWLRPLLRDGESAFVSEFERWSAYGPAADRRWLLRRGH